MKILRNMTDNYLAKEITSLTELIEAMSSGMIEAELDDLKTLEKKRDDLADLRDINLRLTLAEVGVPYDILLSKREKKIFFKLLKVYMKWTTLKKVFGKS